MKGAPKSEDGAGRTTRRDAGAEAGGAGYTETNTGANGFKTFLPNCGVNWVFTLDITGLAAVAVTRVRSIDRIWVGTATVDWTRRRPMPYS